MIFLPAPGDWKEQKGTSFMKDFYLKWKLGWSLILESFPYLWAEANDVVATRTWCA